MLFEKFLNVSDIETFKSLEKNQKTFPAVTNTVPARMLRFDIKAMKSFSRITTRV